MTGRILLFVFAAVFACGDALDDAVGAWAKKISSHLAADEIAHVTWREAGEAGTADAAYAGYATRAKTLLARALQRRLRNPKVVEVTATLSQNLKGYLFVAEMRRDSEAVVEMASVPRSVSAADAPAGFRLERRLLWEQEAPILDVATTGDLMFVLDSMSVTRYEQRDSKWQKAESASVEVPAVRDLRGRLTVMENSVVAEVPGLICRGGFELPMSMDCQDGGRFTAARNTIEETGWPPYFAHGEIGGNRIILAADGRTSIYEGPPDGRRAPTSVPDAWGDFAVVSSACTTAKIVASDAASDSLAIFELVNRSPVRVSDATEMSGAITALWPAGDAALAVVRNKKTDRYEAYSIGVACGR